MRRHEAIRIWVLGVGVAMIIAALWLSNCSAMQVDTPEDWPPFAGGTGEGPWTDEIVEGECPDGREWTEWCGCQPPLYGDDC